MNCLHSIRIKNKLQSHKKVCQNNNFCNIVMSSESSKTLEFNQYKKSNRATFIIYANLQSLIKKTDGCKNNPENSSTRKVGERISLDFSMPTILSFKSIENKHDVYKGKDCMKQFCESLREQAMKIINFKKKKWSN